MSARIHDHGQDDPLPFELGGWAPAARKVREHIEQRTGHALTQIALPRERSSNVIELPVNGMTRTQILAAIERNEAEIAAWGDDHA